ncbi:Os03g0705550 [Oryza sativa Japonica Group]|uniref:Os03g0705550 protein n=1 Tax=Oryza sativa subsp. japonica TaxID=39947 RepID=A0A0P0W2M1_ORYSJ|nr:hypothetical protein EE612_019925 [Oryza sativa]BAS85975.1 Os03g0705550 [Oryza sativa Japonica Group]
MPNLIEQRTPPRWRDRSRPRPGAPARGASSARGLCLPCLPSLSSHRSAGGRSICQLPCMHACRSDRVTPDRSDSAESPVMRRSMDYLSTTPRSI